MWYRYGLKLHEVSYVHKYAIENKDGRSRYGFNFTMNGNSVPIEFIITENAFCNEPIDIYGGFFNGFFIGFNLLTKSLNNFTSSNPLYISHRKFIKLLFIFAHEFGHYMQHKNLDKQISSLLNESVFKKQQNTSFFRILYNIQMALKSPEDVLNYKKNLLDIFINNESYLLQVQACFRIEANASEFAYKFDRNLWDYIGYSYTSNYHKIITEKILWINDFIMQNKKIFALVLILEKMPIIELSNIPPSKVAIFPQNEEDIPLDEEIPNKDSDVINENLKENHNDSFVSIIDLLRNSNNWESVYQSVIDKIDPNDLFSAIAKIEKMTDDVRNYLKKANAKFLKRRPRRKEIENFEVSNSIFATTLREMLKKINIEYMNT